MKKYILFSLVLLFTLALSGFHTDSASAYAPGCTATSAYSTTTGQPCGNTTTGCATGDLYSSTTGQLCPVSTPTRDVFTRDLSAKLKSRGDDVKLLQQFLKDEGYLFGKVDGKFGKVTGRAVGDFQEDNDLTRTEIVDVATRAILNNVVPPGPVEYPTYDQPVISGVSGPQKLNVNQSGTWKVTAYDKSGGSLIYNVVWGDEEPGFHVSAAGSPDIESQNKQSATLTHSYSTTGKYNPTFTVTNSSGQSAKTSIGVNVSGTTTTSAITVRSPNGGERWAKGTTHDITWATNIVSYPTMSNVPVTISLTDSSGTVRTLASNITNSGYYSWAIPNCTVANPCSSNFEIAPGSYTVSVSFGGYSSSAYADSSDAPFTILATSTTNRSPHLYQPAVPTSINVGQPANFTFGAYDSDNDNLVWGVDWGDSDSHLTGACPTNPFTGTGQGWSYNISHTWAQARTYTVTVTVDDCKGGSDSTFFNVTVGGTTTTPTLNVSLDASTPTSRTLSPGQKDVVFAKIKISAGSQDVNNMNAIQIGSTTPDAATLLTNFRIFDGALQLSSTDSALLNNGSYYYKWINVSGVSIPANSSKILTVMADVKNGDINSGNVRLGIAGWNFSGAGAQVIPFGIGTAIYGNNMTISGTTVTPSITSFTATPSTITSGQSSTLAWTSTNATDCGLNYLGNPGGGAFNQNGSLAVTPTQTTTYTMTCSNSSLQTANASVTVTVNPVSTGVFTVTTPPTLTMGQSYTIQWSDPLFSSTSSYGIYVSNSTMGGKVNSSPIVGTQQFVWTVGQVAMGSAIQPGDGYLITVLRSSSGGYMSSLSFTIIPASVTNSLTITTSSPLPNARVGSYYNKLLDVSRISDDLSVNYNWTVVSGSLPPGLALLNNNFSSVIFEGTPTITGTYTFSFKVTAGSQSTIKQFILTVDPASSSALHITTASPLPNARIGTPYSSTLSASGGGSSYVWSTSSTLPPGLTLSSSGLITGTPTFAGTTYTFSVQVTSGSQTDAKSFDLTTDPASNTTGLTVTSSSPLPEAQGNVAYAVSLEASGRTDTTYAGRYIWSITAGSLPSGLTMDENGNISGTPALTAVRTESYTFTVGVASVLQVGTKQFSLKVNPAPVVVPVPTISISTIPATIPANQPYTISWTASNVSRPYSLSVYNIATGQGAFSIDNIPSTATSYQWTPTGAMTSARIYLSTSYVNSSGINQSVLAQSNQFAVVSSTVSVANTVSITAVSRGGGTIAQNSTFDVITFTAKNNRTDTSVILGTVAIRARQAIGDNPCNFSEAALYDSSGAKISIDTTDPSIQPDFLYDGPGSDICIGRLGFRNAKNRPELAITPGASKTFTFKAKLNSARNLNTGAITTAGSPFLFSLTEAMFSLAIVRTNFDMVITSGLPIATNPMTVGPTPTGARAKSTSALMANPAGALIITY